MKELEAKLKNEAYVKALEKEGINVSSLKEELKIKQNGIHQGVSKPGV